MKVKTLIIGGLMMVSTYAGAQHFPPDSTTTEAVEKSSIQIFAPNAFTPSGDFYNNTWRIYAEGIDIYNFHLTIFNSDGRIVWESYDAEAQWDGNFAGYSVADGVYVWLIETKEADSDKREQLTGFITVLR